MGRDVRSEENRIASQCRFRLGVGDDGVLDGLETADADRHRLPRTTARENIAARHPFLFFAPAFRQHFAFHFPRLVTTRIKLIGTRKGAEYLTLLTPIEFYNRYLFIPDAYFFVQQLCTTDQKLTVDIVRSFTKLLLAS